MEEAWVITISLDEVSHLLVLFNALEYGKIEKIDFHDSFSRLSMKLKIVKEKKQPIQYALTFGSNMILLSKNWFESVVSLLIDVSLYGWSNTAHIDYDASTTAGNVTVSFYVTQLKNIGKTGDGDVSSVD